MTEDQAKEKWCPFVRHYTGDTDNGEGIDPAANRWGRRLNPEACRCIASECMAWRWQAMSRDGYCGLAGQPPLSLMAE